MDKNFFDGIDKLAYKTVFEALNVDKNKGLIAVVVAYNPLSPICESGETIAKAATEGIIDNGFNAKTFFIPAPTGVSEGQTDYKIQLRQQCKFFAERLGATQLFDGFVFVASDPYMLAGLLYGAITCNLPCLFLGNGLMPALKINGNEYGLTGLNGIAAQLRYGKLSSSILEESDTFITEGLGNDPYDYHSNSGIFLMQSLGLALPNVASVTSGSIAQRNLAKQTGAKICEMARRQQTPSKMLNNDAFKMAAAVDLALGGDPTTYVNIAWLSFGVKEPMSFKLLPKIAALTPVLVDTKPFFDIKKFDQEGGIFAVINQISSAQVPIYANYLMFDNTQMIDYCAKYTSTNIVKEFVQSQTLPSAYLLSGNFADSALSYPSQKTTFNGNAKVFDNEDALIDAILNKKIKSGDCVVLTYCGAKAGLITPNKAASMLVGAGLSSSVAFVTDGIVPNFYDGISASLVYPEAYDDGVIAYVKDGDKIEINLSKQKLNVDLKAKDISTRRKQIEIKKIESNSTRYTYFKLVTPAYDGCNIVYNQKKN